MMLALETSMADQSRFRSVLHQAITGVLAFGACSYLALDDANKDIITVCTRSPSCCPRCSTSTSTVIPAVLVDGERGKEEDKGEEIVRRQGPEKWAPHVRFTSIHVQRSHQHTEGVKIRLDPDETRN
jgi:hypothetical protein